MSAQVGFAGYYTPDGWVPITVRIDNPGPAVSAEFDIAAYASLGSGRETNTVFRWLRRLQPGSQTLELSLPAPLLAQSPVLQCLVQGRLATTVTLSGNEINNVSLAAVLSSSPQDAQFLTGVSSPPGWGAETVPVLPVAVGSSAIPTDANLMGGLAIVAASPAELARLSTDQAHALQTWVDLGGVLVVTGSGRAGGAWQSWLPMIPGAQRLVAANGLSSLGGQGGSAPPSQITIAASGVRSGAQIWAGDASAPLLAAWPQGRGWVVQSAFAPRDLLTWSGNAAFWTAVMRRAHAGIVSASPPWFASTGPMTLSTASETLAPLRVPSLQVWLWVTTAYVAVAGPVTFWLLRRLRREPWAWLWLPVLAVGVTAAIYMAGAGSRPSGLLTEGVGVLELIRDGEAEAYGVRSFMSPWTISATLSLPRTMLAIPMAEQTGAPEIATVSDDGAKTQIDFADVERWGVRYAYSAGTLSGQGWIDTWLTAAQGTLYGAVRNRTPYTLHHVTVCWDGQAYTVGDLGPGMTAALPTSPSFTYHGNDLWSQYGSLNRDLARGVGRSLAAWSTSLGAPVGADQAMILATVAGARMAMLPDVSVRAPTASNATVVLVRELISVGNTAQTGGVVHDPHTKPE